LGIVSRQGKPPSGHNGDLTRVPHEFVLEVYPQPEKTDVPDHLPDGAANAFKQAVEGRKGGLYDAAGAMYRKALDVGLKTIDPQAMGTLQARIDKLAAEQKLTPSIKDWAHEIRLDGNEAAHEESPFTKDDAEQMHSFAQLVLTYLFTLPERVKLRGKAKTQPPSA
jgi:hypothetical protein